MRPANHVAFICQALALNTINAIVGSVQDYRLKVILIKKRQCMQMAELPSSLLPYVYSYLVDLNLHKAAKALKKETTVVTS